MTASAPAVNLQPRLALSAESKAAERQSKREETVAPEVGAASSGDASLHRLIAISAAPAAPAPEVSVPQGNLSARVAISPEGNRPGAPGGAANAPVTNGGTGGNSDSSACRAAGSSIVLSRTQGLASEASSRASPQKKVDGSLDID